jgi:hypothetical protein
MDRELGAVPQGIIEQARARPVDPGKLQLLGKQAAAMYSSQRTPLSDAVLQVIENEDLGPEHARRVCEFANQAAFQSEWEKGGSARNIEFSGGPADPSVVLKGMNDGSQSEAPVQVNDYSAPPPAPHARNVEDEIFGKTAAAAPVSGVSDLQAMRTTAIGAREHVMSKVSSLTTRLEVLREDLGHEAKKLVLQGEPMSKIAAAWSFFGTEGNLLNAIKCASARLVNDHVLTSRQFDVSLHKTAAAGSRPNPEHGVVATYIEFCKTANELQQLQGALNVFEDRIADINSALKSAITGGTQLQKAVGGFESRIQQIESGLPKLGGAR